MQITTKQIRRLIQEEMLKNIPEFVLNETTRKFVEDIKLQLQHHISSDGDNDSSTTNAYTEADAILLEIEAEVNELLQQKLTKFLQKS